MSVKIMSLVWDTKRFFSASEKLVLLKIADCAADDGSHAYPSHSTIAEECSLSNRQAVIRILRRLYEKGVLTRKVTSSRGKKINNRYSINIAMLKQIVQHLEGLQGVDNSEKVVHSSVPKTLRVVSQGHYGSVPGTHKTSTDPSLDPSTIVNTKKTVDKNTTDELTKKLHRLEQQGTITLDQIPTLQAEVTFHIENRAINLSPMHSLNAAIKLIREQRWSTPYQLLNTEIKQREDDYERFKQEERDSVINNPIAKLLSENFRRH